MIEERTVGADLGSDAIKINGRCSLACQKLVRDYDNGEIVIDLRGQYTAFRTWIGVQWQGGKRGSVVFRVAVDTAGWPEGTYQFQIQATARPALGEFAGDTMFRESFAAMQRHLGDTGQVELANTPWRLGRMLTYDAQAENFVEAPDANQLLTQSYRGPFVVPERV